MAEKQSIHRLGAQMRSLPPALQSLVSYWLQKCGGRPMPARASAPVEELRPWLGNLAVIEISGDERFRFRLSGTNLIRRLGRETTGLDVDELADDLRRQLRAILTMAAKAAAPIVAESSVPLGRATYWYCDVALPLTGPTGLPAFVLFCSYPVKQT